MFHGSRGRNARGDNNRESTFRGRGGARGNGASRTGGLNGLFADGLWKCDCIPRLPAGHFEVKKEGKNQRRWFYTCQNTESKQCDFFLWDENAKFREEGAVLNNSRTEPQNRRMTGAQEGWDADRSRPKEGIFANVHLASEQKQDTAVRKGDESIGDGSPSSLYSTRRAVTRRTKRSADAAGIDEDEELFPWHLTGREEEEMANAVDPVVQPETPQRAMKAGVYATPATTTKKKTKQLPWLKETESEVPMTPKSPTQPAQSHVNYFNTPSKPPAKPLHPILELHGPATPTLQLPTPAIGPKSLSPPSRHRDALLNPADATSSLTCEALLILSSIAIPAETLSNLRSILTKHDLKAQGVIKGRDISRLGLKAKDAKIAELHARIASLEAEREVDRGVIRSLRWKEECGRQSDEDDGEL